MLVFVFVSASPTKRSPPAATILSIHHPTGAHEVSARLAALVSIMVVAVACGPSWVLPHHRTHALLLPIDGVQVELVRI